MKKMHDTLATTVKKLGGTVDGQKLNIQQVYTKNNEMQGILDGHLTKLNRRMSTLEKNQNEIKLNVNACLRKLKGENWVDLGALHDALAPMQRQMDAMRQQLAGLQDGQEPDEAVFSDGGFGGEDEEPGVTTETAIPLATPRNSATGQQATSAQQRTASGRRVTPTARAAQAAQATHGAWADDGDDDDVVLPPRKKKVRP